MGSVVTLNYTGLIVSLRDMVELWGRDNHALTNTHASILWRQYELREAFQATCPKGISVNTSLWLPWCLFGAEHRIKYWLNSSLSSMAVFVSKIPTHTWSSAYREAGNRCIFTSCVGVCVDRRAWCHVPGHTRQKDRHTREPVKHSDGFLSTWQQNRKHWTDQYNPPVPLTTKADKTVPTSSEPVLPELL